MTAFSPRLEACAEWRDATAVGVPQEVVDGRVGALVPRGKVGALELQGNIIRPNPNAV
jgi:hypothetical protein